MDKYLEDIYKEIPRSKCAENCGDCCTILFPSLRELRNIKEYCERKHIEYKDFTMKLDEKCPYLTADKKCEIHEVKPFLCRIMGVAYHPALQCAKCVPDSILTASRCTTLYKKIYLVGKESRRSKRHKKVVAKLLLELENVKGRKIDETESVGKGKP